MTNRETHDSSRAADNPKSHQSQDINESLFLYNSNEKASLRDHAWMHVSCSLWFFPCQTESKEPLNVVERLNVDWLTSSQWGECQVCRLSGQGPTVKCANGMEKDNIESCGLRFHVECARKGKLSIEMNCIAPDSSHSLYCSEHKVNKVKRLKDQMNRKRLLEIESFSDILKRNYEHIKRQTNRDFSIFIPVKKSKSKEYCKFKPPSYEDTRTANLPIQSRCPRANRIMSQTEVEQMLESIRRLSISLSLAKGSLLFKQSSKGQWKLAQGDRTTVGENLTVYHILDRDFFPWRLVKVGDYTLEEMLENFKSHCHDEFAFDRLVRNPIQIRKNRVTSFKPRVKRINQEVLKEQRVFCYCKDLSNSSLMIGRSPFI